MKNISEQEIHDALHEAIDQPLMNWTPDHARRVSQRAQHIRPHRWPWALGVVGTAVMFGALGLYLSHKGAPRVGPGHKNATPGKKTTHTQPVKTTTTTTTLSPSHPAMVSDILRLGKTTYSVLVPQSAANVRLSGTIHKGFLYWFEPPAFGTSRYSNLGMLGSPQGLFTIKAIRVPVSGTTINPANAKTVGVVPQKIPGQTIGGLYNESGQIFVTQGTLVVIAANSKSGMNQPMSYPVYVLRPHQPWQLLTQVYFGGGSFYSITVAHGNILWNSSTSILTPTGMPILGSAYLYNIDTGITQSIATPYNESTTTRLSGTTANAAGVSVPLDTIPRPQWTPGSSPAPAGARFPADWPTIASVTKVSQVVTRLGFRVSLLASGSYRSPLTPEITVSEGNLAQSNTIPSPSGVTKTIRGFSVKIANEAAWWQEGHYHYYVHFISPSAGSSNPPITSWVKRIMDELPPWGNPGGPNTSGTVDATINNFQDGKNPWTRVSVSLQTNNGSGIPTTVVAGSVTQAFAVAGSLVP